MRAFSIKTAPIFFAKKLVFIAPSATFLTIDPKAVVIPAIDKDIKPLSEVRTGIANFIKQVHDTKRPLVITQHGKGVAVLMDVHEYEAIQERLELLTDVQISLNQIENGKGKDHEDAKQKVVRRVLK